MVAERLSEIIQKAGYGRGKTVTAFGNTYNVSVVNYRGSQVSPFADRTASNIDFTITNVISGETIEGPGLIVETIKRYGFYEGTVTPYRVDPMQLIKVLGLR